MYRNCLECGNPFETSSKAKICSDSCRKERASKSHRERYLKNPDIAKERVRRHRKRDGYMALQQKWNNKWRVNNRKKVLEIRIKSQHKIYQTLKQVGFVTDEIREDVYNRDDHTCLACGNKANLTIDHIVPISKGGFTTIDNLQTLCNVCNSRKQQQVIDYTK